MSGCLIAGWVVFEFGKSAFLPICEDHLGLLGYVCLNKPILEVTLLCVIIGLVVMLIEVSVGHWLKSTYTSRKQVAVIVICTWQIEYLGRALELLCILQEHRLRKQVVLKMLITANGLGTMLQFSCLGNRFQRNLQLRP